MAVAALSGAEAPTSDPRRAYSPSWGTFMPRVGFVSETRGRVIAAAVQAGDIDLGLSLASGFEKGWAAVNVRELVVALELANRKQDIVTLAARAGIDPKAYIFDVGAALAQSGRSQEIEAYVKPNRMDAYEIAAMQIAGALMARKADLVPGLLSPLKGNERENALIQSMNILRSARRVAVGAPLIALRDLKTPDGVVECGLVAAATRDAALADRCSKALSALSERDKKSGDFGSRVVPNVIGALAATGKDQEVISLMISLPRASRNQGVAKLSQYARSPELLAIAKTYLTGNLSSMNEFEAGDFLVRMLVLAGQNAEALELVAKAPDPATRDEWARRQAEALAETGLLREALQAAQKIGDGASRANALAAVAEVLN